MEETTTQVLINLCSHLRKRPNNVPIATELDLVAVRALPELEAGGFTNEANGMRFISEEVSKGTLNRDADYLLGYFEPARAALESIRGS